VNSLKGSDVMLGDDPDAGQQ